MLKCILYVTTELSFLVKMHLLRRVPEPLPLPLFRFVGFHTVPIPGL